MEPAGPESYITFKVPPYLGVDAAGVVVVAGLVVVAAGVVVVVAGVDVAGLVVVAGDVVVVLLVLQPTSTKEITNRIARTITPLFTFFLLKFFIMTS
jgi:hypothetical protein